MGGRQAADSGQRVPVSVGQLREDPDQRYCLLKHRYGGKMRVVEVTSLGADGKASVKVTATGRSSKVKISTLERWRVVG